jgi:RimJ/RimL family protein N-acetyltransferase
MTTLHTARLTLRPCCPDDRADFVALEQDPEVMRYLNGGHPTTGQSDPDGPFLTPRGTEPHLWTARRPGNDAFVGWFCLWPDGDGLAELGYRLRRQDWGQGLASEGALALVTWGLTSGGHARIGASTMAVNLASRRVMEKIGMTFQHSFHPSWSETFPGTEHGEVWYEIRQPTPASP